MPEKRDWIIRMCDLLHNLQLNVIYNVSNIRDFLKENFNDSISLPTTGELLKRIILAHEKGMMFKIGNKFRKLEKKTNYSGDARYELIEYSGKL